MAAGEGAKRAGAERKQSYSIPCASAFRDRVSSLAASKGVNVGDLARSIMLTAPAAAIDAFPDPGEPAKGDRETVVLQSGPSAGKPWKRKPRLQVRLPKGQDVVRLRKALALALAMEAGAVRLTVEDGKAPDRAATEAAFREETERLRAMVKVLAAEPLPDGVRSRDEALFVLGFPPGARPPGDRVKARYRMLAAVLHPDSGVGDTAQMAQLNAAMAYLRRT